MIIECRKGEKAFSRLNHQPNKKPNVAFCIYIIETEIDKFPSRNLFANPRFAVEIFQFRLSIVVIMIIECRKGEKAFSRLNHQPNTKPNVAFCIYIFETEIDKFPSRNLFANPRFAVEIYQFRLSIVVIVIDGQTQCRGAQSRKRDSSDRRKYEAYKKR